MIVIFIELGCQLRVYVAIFFLCGRNCSALNYAFGKHCTFCGVVFGIKEDSGWPNNTKSSDGYAVSSGRPTNTKASNGCIVGISGGRRSGTKSH